MASQFHLPKKSSMGFLVNNKSPRLSFLSLRKLYSARGFICKWKYSLQKSHVVNPLSVSIQASNQKKRLISDLRQVIKYVEVEHVKLDDFRVDNDCFVEKGFMAALISQKAIT